MPARDPLRVAVVGHLEWATFAVVERVPVQGEIVSTNDTWEEAAGGGAVAVVQLAKLAGSAAFYTALGSDDFGRRARGELQKYGVDVHAGDRDQAQRRAFIYLDAEGERTITTLGERIVPEAGDRLPWDDLEGFDAVYFTGGDSEALRRARAARFVVSTPRALRVLSETDVQIDALVHSGHDEAERYRPGDLDPPPLLVVTTLGAEGGVYEPLDGEAVEFDPQQLPGPTVDAYGAGDSFAGGLTYGLAAFDGDPAAAVELASRCGAANFTGRGPYAGQLRGPV